jgi:hypothetical protein
LGASLGTAQQDPAARPSDSERACSQATKSEKQKHALQQLARPRDPAVAGQGNQARIRKRRPEHAALDAWGVAPHSSRTMEYQQFDEEGQLWPSG